jgi:hypothetical protein
MVDWKFKALLMRSVCGELRERFWPTISTDNWSVDYRISFGKSHPLFFCPRNQACRSLSILSGWMWGIVSLIDRANWILGVGRFGSLNRRVPGTY